MIPLAFAIPGDINTLTGGYIYEKRLLEGLRARGHDVRHVELDAGFPDADECVSQRAAEALAAIPQDRPVIVDGLVFGSLDPRHLERVAAPLVAMIHHPLALESGLSQARARVLFETERTNLRRAAHVLVPSQHTRDILVERYDTEPGRITVAQPGSDRPTGPQIPADPPLILSVGIQHPRKGHDTLLRALDEIRDLDWQAVIVGKRHDEGHAAELQTLLRELDLGARVRLAGRVPQEEISALYRAASIFALATRYEGYGIVFDEALVHGLPVVSCSTGAVPDTVPAASGRLVPPDAPDRFAAALRSLLTDPEELQSMARAAADAGRTRPTWRETAETAGRAIETHLR